jgi:RNA polymerase sigma factor (sigma-70 family)
MKQDWADKTDEELMEAFYAGENAAFEELVRRYSSVLRAQVGFWGTRRNMPDVDDLAQEVFLLVARTREGPSRFQSGAGTSFRRWLLAIARNRWLQELRYRGYRKRDSFSTSQRSTTQRRESEDTEFSDSVDPLEMAIEARGPRSEEVVAAEELHAALLECINELPEEMRHCINLSLDGSSLSEIATSLNRSYQSVANMLYRARSRLRECLECKAYGPFGPPSSRHREG